MRETLARYGHRIASGEIDPHVRWDGHSGTVLDCTSDEVPLLVLSFGIQRLRREPAVFNTGEREHVIVLVDGKLRLRSDQEAVELERLDGPFAGYPDLPPACCVYVPLATQYSLQGEGEVVVFSAPAAGDMPLRVVAPGEKRAVSRGAAFWRRDVVTLVEPFEASTNLVVGETHSPPGLWSGMPAHVHDKEDPEGGQSDHEEVYCFRVRGYSRGRGPGAVQLLYGSKGLDEAYAVGDWSVVALPGGCHPVVASPTAEIVYIWGMASDRPQSLRLRDVPDSAFLKDVEAAFRQLTEDLSKPDIAAADFHSVARVHRLGRHSRRVLAQMLREYGFGVKISAPEGEA